MLFLGNQLVILVKNLALPAQELLNTLAMPIVVLLKVFNMRFVLKS